MNKTYKKGLIFLIISLVLLVSLTSCITNSDKTLQTKTLTDITGRQVEIPTDITKVYAADPGSMILLYTFNPDLLIGWSYKFNDAEAEFILPRYLDLPVLGMGSQVNYEAVISANPQVAIMVGKDNDASREKADKLQEQVGVPVVIVDLALTSAVDTYLMMGDVTGDERRGEELSAYAESAFNSIKDIPQDERVSVYYANGIDNLNTSARGSAASQLFDIIYAENVCELESESGDRLQVTKEHLLSWNPDYIFVNGEPKESISGSTAAQQLISNPEYANIQAVIDGNVISIPKAPFAWVDRPRSENRLIGIKWLGSIIYPEYYDFTTDDIKEFYKLFYHTDLTDEQVETLLNQ